MSPLLSPRAAASLVAPMAGMAGVADAQADPINRERRGFLDNKLVLLPLATGLSFPLTFLITYGVAVGNRHVAPGFPFISDTGAAPPESCIFGQLLNTASALAALTIYVKYRQLQAVTAEGDQRETQVFRQVNYFALCLGFAAAFGVTLVANFQWTHVLSVHMLGAFLIFVVGIAYGWLHCWLTCRAPPPLRGARLQVARILVMSMASLCLLLTVIGTLLAKELRFVDYKFTPDPFALLATVAEWALAIALATMFLTFVVDFRFVQVAAPEVTALNRDRGPSHKDLVTAN